MVHSEQIDEKMTSSMWVNCYSLIEIRHKTHIASSRQAVSIDHSSTAVIVFMELL